MKINKPFFRLTAALATGAVIMLSSCKKDDDPQPTPTNTITDVVVNNASYSVLKEAVVKANLATTLSGTGPFTVFAPDNTAFSNAAIYYCIIPLDLKFWQLMCLPVLMQKWLPPAVIQFL
jgi:Fasciclin domain